jgi:sugar O-acyltransferase (sialic acid O-acetyltransferase NeuD family)
MFRGLPQVAFETVEQHYSPQDTWMIALDGTLPKSRAVADKAKAKGYRLASYVSPKAVISQDMVLGENTVIFELAYVGYRVKLGSSVLIRQHVYLGHDGIIGNNVTINPSARLGGGCVVHDHAFIGIGATIIDKRTIGHHSVVGAGSVVVKDVPDATTVIGNPAKALIKE